MKVFKDGYLRQMNIGFIIGLIVWSSLALSQDTSPVDPNLIKCENHGQCSNGQGCFPFSEDYMFETESNDPEIIKKADKDRSYLEEQFNSLSEDPKSIGASCQKNIECESYNCKDSKCQANNICRLAEEDEYAPGAIKCEPPLVKSSTNYCVSPERDLYSVGLVGDISVQEVAGQQCQFDLYPSSINSQTGAPLTPEDVQRAAKLALVTTRAMEWLFATTSNNNHEDCLFTMRWMRERMKPMVEERKKILKSFNQDMLAIEESFKMISEAKKGDMTAIVSPCGDKTTKHDIALRRASGLDFLCYMQNRNSLFMAYEEAMNNWVTKVADFSKIYADSAFSWEEDKNTWNIGSNNYSWEDHECRNWPRWNKIVKRRWGQRYKVYGEAPQNRAVIERPMVKSYLNLTGGGISRFLQTHFLLDPLMPGGYNNGVSFENFGSPRFFNGEKDRKLSWGDDGYIAIHSKMKNNLINFYKGMNTEGITNFIYEPEIPSSYEYRGCIENIDQPKCSQFKTFIETIQDASFAQMVSYSKHYKSKYKYYFKRDVWRKHLYNRMEVDFVNLQKYYIALSDLRDKQNSCIQRVIDQLQGAEFSGTGQGLAEGNINYYNAGPRGYLGATPQDGKKMVVRDKSYKRPHNFKLAAYNLTQSSGALKDSISKTSAGGTGVISGARSNASLASRTKALNEKNQKALASGVRPAQLEKEFMEQLTAAGAIGSGFGGAMAAGKGSSSTSMGQSGVMPSLGDLNSSKEKQAGPNNDDIKPARGNELPGPYGAGALTSSTHASENSSTPGGDSNDPSGMSDEEKDIIAANYVRNKSQYDPKEEDTLFQVLSKTYIRNMDKILTRKKKLEGDSASSGQ